MARKAKRNQPAKAAESVGGEVVVVYVGSMGDAADPIPHEGTRILGSDPSRHALTLEAGVSIIRREIVEDHLENGRLGALVDDGQVRIFDELAEVLELPVGELRDLLASTRHGRALREMHAIERARATPRRGLIAILGKRRRFYEEHAPVQIPPITHIKPLRPKSAEVPAEASAASAEAG